MKDDRGFDDRVLFDRFHNRLVITGQLVALTGLRIGVGRSTSPVGSDLPVLRDALDRPYIPGASLKGVLRSGVEGFLRTLAGDKVGACYPVGDEQVRCLDDAGLRRLKTRYSNDDAQLAQELWSASCLACRTFGSQWLASHVYISDLAVVPALWAGQYEVRNGVSIDRDTETAKEGMLYEFETVPAGVAFRCRIEGENLADWQAALLLLALRPFERGEATIGGATSRGLGRVKLAGMETNYFALDAGDLVGQMIAYLEQGAQGSSPTMVQREAWQKALREELAAAHQRAVEKGAVHAEAVV